MEMECFCGSHYKARLADIRRGWGKTCSKRCAAIKREYGRPNGKPVKKSETVKYGKKPSRVAEHRRNTEIKADQKAKDAGYYPFFSENEMYESMCDNPIEGR